MANKYFDYEYDNLANELTQNLVEEFTEKLEEIELKAATKLNEHFEKIVNEKCEEIIKDIFSDAELNFNTSDNENEKISLDVWSDAELIHTFDLNKALDETVDFLQDDDDDRRSKALAKIFRRFAERLEAD